MRVTKYSSVHLGSRPCSENLDHALPAHVGKYLKGHQSKYLKTLQIKQKSSKVSFHKTGEPKDMLVLGVNI